MMANYTTQVDYFAGFSEWDELRCLFMAFHFIITFVGPMLLSCVIWYENNGCDVHYRTVVNILLSHSCWINLVRCIFARVPYVILMALGPHSRPTCDGIMFIGRFFYQALLSQILLWQVMKYIYIFHWNNVVALNDEFIACFVTATNLMLILVLTVTTSTIGFHNTEEDFHICTGNNPLINLNQTPFLQLSLSSAGNPLELLDSLDPSGKVHSFIMISMVLVSLRIWAYIQADAFIKVWKTLTDSQREVAQDSVSFQTPEESFFHKIKTSIIGAAGSLVAAIFMVLLMLPARITRKIFIANMDEINYGHGRTMMYMSRINLAIFSYCLLPVVLICSSQKMRQTVWKEIKLLCSKAIKFIFDYFQKIGV